MAGRSVMAYQRDIVPRQWGKRFAMLTLVGLIMAAVISLAAWLIQKQNTSHTPATPTQRTDAATTDRGSDLTSHAPLFWGVRLDSPAVVLIDATQASEAWLSDAVQQVRQVHDVLQESNVPVTFVFFTGTQIDMPRFASDAPLPTALDAITANGSLLPADALSRLSSLHPTRVVLVSSQQLTASQVQAIDKVLDESVRLDVIWVGKLPEGLDAVVTFHNGACITR
jgi:hypothetical protein